MKLLNTRQRQLSLVSALAALAWLHAAVASTPAPTVELKTSPVGVESGSTSTLTWSSTDASSCTASGAWSGSFATSGSATTEAITAPTTYTLTCTGAGGTTAITRTVYLADQVPQVTFTAQPTTVASGGYSTLSWSSVNSNDCRAYGPWSGSEGTQGSTTTDGLATTTTFVLTCFNPSGAKTSAKATITVSSSTPPPSPPSPPSPPPSPPSAGQVQRPSYNTGDGFFVYEGKLYDANGNEFRIRGVNRCHFDSNSQPGISRSKANAVRMFMYELSLGASTYANVIQNQHIDYQEVPILSMPMFPDNTLSSGNQSTSELSAGVAWWVANAKTFAPLSKYLIINIANEWGPSNSTVWRDSYISAITQMRAAGYSGPLLIDSGGYGQDPDDILNYGAAVFNSDPQKNVILSYHDYSPVSSLAYFPQFAALASQGVMVIIGEFGPGRDIGPSPTMLTPGQVITTAETNGLGWIAWAWDDNNLANGASDNNWFSMTYAGPGIYNVASDLTEYGQDVVLNSTYGLSVLATPASIFE
jgi:Cellulase (glycosyl hydrolase family 5)